VSVIKKLMSIEVSIPLSSRTKHTQKTRILESYNSYEKVQITNCWSIIEGTPHLVIRSNSKRRGSSNRRSSCS